jgi:hypothetical protein
MELYSYRPLDNTRMIRLFALASGLNPYVTIIVVHVSLDEKPQYEALSYVWGDPAITEPIIVCEWCLQD